MDATTMTNRGRSGRLLLVALTATAGLTLLPGTPARAAVTDATIANFTFSPDPITIPVGGTIKWTNTDVNVTHTVTADDGSFDSGSLGTHGTFVHSFGQAGTITYHCNIHSSMHGTIQVGAATTTTTAPVATTTTTAAPTTTTTARPTTTTTAPVTTTTRPPGTAAPTTTAPRSTTTKAAGPSTTRATAAPTTTTGPPADTAPTNAAVAPPEPPAAAPAETTPPTQVAQGVTTRPTGHGRAGAAGLGAVAILALAGAGWWALRRRRSSLPTSGGAH